MEFCQTSQQAGGICGLYKEIIHPDYSRPFPILRNCVWRKGDNANGCPDSVRELSDLYGCRVPAPPRHPNTHQYPPLVTRRVGFHGGNRFASVDAFLHDQAVTHENFPHNLTIQRVVIHKEHPLAL